MSERVNKRALVTMGKEMRGLGMNCCGDTMGTRSDKTCSSIPIPKQAITEFFSK
jgi:hypothetical protein